MSKTAVIFPGIGYHCDRPLLYFSTKLAMAAGYEIIKIEYPFCAVDLLKADRSQLRAFSESCVSAALEQIREKGDPAEGEMLFISKSIGTAIAAACGAALPGKIRHIYFTPLEKPQKRSGTLL